MLETKRVEGFEFGPFRLDLMERRLFHQGRPILLAPITFDIAKTLLENNGHLVTKEQMFKEVWPNRFVEENNLTVRISYLRRILGETAENKFIETVPGSGYRFVARVREVLGTYRSSRKQAFESLAVLPMTNLSGQERLNYLSDGLTESIISSLSHAVNLRVMAWSTICRFKGRNPSPQEVGHELRVKTVLAGTVAQTTEGLLFNFELIDVKDGAYLWGAKIERHFANLVTLQEELATEIADNLRIKLNKAEEVQLTKRHTHDPQAYQWYLKGRYFYNKRRAWCSTRAIRYLKRAIRQDPNYALAYAGLADAYLAFSGFGFRLSPTVMPKAKAAALKALHMDNQLAEPHVTLGNIRSSFEYDWGRAEKEFKRALELNPQYAPAHYYYANFLAKLGRFDEARLEANKAHDIDPLSLHVNLLMAKVLMFARRFDEAIKQTKELLEFEPLYGPAYGALGIAYLETGRPREALREFKVMFDLISKHDVTPRKRTLNPGKALVKNWDPEALSFLGYAYAITGNRKKAVACLEDLARAAKERYVQPYHAGMIYIALGENDKAFECLDKAITERCTPITLAKVFSFYDPIRPDPRFDDFLARLGLEAMSSYSA